MRVIRVKLAPVDKSNLIRRGLEHFELAWKLAKASSLLDTPPDSALVYSPPLPLGLTAIEIRRRFGTPFVFNVQDLFPEEAIHMGLIKNPLVIRFLEELEEKIYREADLITVHSESNADHVRAKLRGQAPSKVKVVYN